MSELDPNLAALLARSRPELGPPAGAPARMLADFHARLPGGPGGGADVGPGPGPEPLGPALSSGASKGAQLLHALKIVGAVAALSTVGVAGLWVAGQAMRPDAPAPVVAEEASSAAASPTAASTTAARSQTPALRETSAAPPTPAASPERGSSATQDQARRPPAGAKSREGGQARTLAAELELIQAARRAPPEQALELLARHARDFPKGELSSEREALRAVSLCELGRAAQAAQAQAKFEALEPGPLLREKVRKACAAGVTQ